MSQTTATRPLEPDTWPADRNVHGRHCYDERETLICNWPERHDPEFTELPALPADRPAAGARPIARLFDRLLTLLIVVVGLAAVGIGVLVYVDNLHFQTVTSGSMRPTASPGDVAVTEVVPVSSLKVGDVIVFFPPGRVAEPVMHRIVSLDNGVIKTRGDANSVEDPWQITLSGATAYRMVAVVPFVGWLGELQRPALIVAGLLLLLAIAIELWKEVRGRTAKARSVAQP